MKSWIVLLAIVVSTAKTEKQDVCTQGYPGIPGNPGHNGTPGRDGRDGSKGDKGDTGEPGIPGVPGKDGANGEKGEQGANGTVEEKGNKGDKGERGQPGKLGPKGVIGNVRVALVKNDIKMLHTVDRYQSGEDQASGAAILELQGGDKVWLQAHQGETFNGLFADADDDTTFSGFLLFSTSDSLEPLPLPTT
ncbi:complement C1q and tumor necrosis factor-related protein 9B-like isoform X2 [Pipra filicauda]|uniref:Complement C1q and tumor necrosis factor-related protein 9B-like isoform X2 n=1 Tax=Pipra filicauda TaxID=649802 RepID=A0A7R5K0V0_9PASS|nr:complement C1q and tumor necrosis factor-related protein 9B-like isoform X2 [Pipra filicauda]